MLLSQDSGLISHISARPAISESQAPQLISWDMIATFISSLMGKLLKTLE